MRRQVYEWRNIMPVGQTVSLNDYPILKPGDVHTIALPANIPVDIFIGGTGNNLDIPAELKAHQFIIIDAIAVWPQNLAAQIYVNTTRYFQNPDGTVSEGISGNVVPFPNGHLGVYNYDYQDGLTPPVYVLPGQLWGIEVTPISAIAAFTGGNATDDNTAFCFVKYLLIDGADALVAQKLLESGWDVTVENIERYKQDLVKHNLFAGLAEMDELEGLDRRV